jgi:hypothetical protein
MQAPFEQDTHSPTGKEISAAVAHGVRAPLAALRASMESLAHGFAAEDPRCLTVRGALDEVVRLGREMQALLDYALPQPAQPSSCSLREIVCSAMDALSAERRAEVLVAIEDRRTRLTVDGPLLSRSIARLLESAMADAHSPALLRARIDGTEAVFALVQGAPPPVRADTEFRLRSAVSTLGAVLARRDVERMGGRFSLRSSADGRMVSEIRFPGEPAGSVEPA